MWRCGHISGLRLLRSIIGIRSGRVSDSMTIIWKNNKDGASNYSNNRRQHLHQKLLTGLKFRIETTHTVGIKQSQHSEHHQREESVHEVPEPELIYRQVEGIRGGRRPQPLGGDDAVVALTVAAGVAVGEGSEGAVESTDDKERSGEVLVESGAVSVVCDDGNEELEEEDGAGGEKLDEVS